MLGLCENPGKYIIVSSLRQLLQMLFYSMQIQWSNLGNGFSFLLAKYVL